MFTSSVYKLLDYLSKGQPAKHESQKNTVFYYYREVYVIFLLAFIGGFMDAAGYIKFNGLFTSSITGNLVAACAAIHVGGGVVARLCVSIAFLVSGLIGFFLAIRLKQGSEWKVKSISMLLYALEALLMLVTFSIGLYYDQEITDNGESLTDWRLIVTSTIMGGAMGMHNAAAKESIPNVPATTVMTMTLVSEASALAQVLSMFLYYHSWLYLAPPAKRAQPLSPEEYAKVLEKLNDNVQKWIVVTRPLVAFMLGGVVGAGLATHITYYCLMVPVGILASMLIDIYFAWVLDNAPAGAAKGNPLVVKNPDSTSTAPATAVATPATRSPIAGTAERSPSSRRSDIEMAADKSSSSSAMKSPLLA